MKNISTKWTLLALAIMHCEVMPAANEAEDAEGFGLTTFFAEARMSYIGQWDDGTKNHEASGIKGEYLNVRVDGQIVRGLTFSYRQRLNKNSDRTFWDATDWCHLDWQATDDWALSVGKQVVAIGGYEYDRAPIDLYFCSEFWGNIPCYQLGLSASHALSSHDQLLLQVCNSPFRAEAGNDTYAINLLWSGQHGCWETLWSVNRMEWMPDQWMTYVALGNNLKLGPTVNLNLDLMNRATEGHAFWGKDCSVMAELNWRPSSAWRLYTKYTYDVNHSGKLGDWCVRDGTEMQSVCAGFESMPLSRHRDAVRIFGGASYCWGKNGNTAPYLTDRRLQVQLGLKWKINLLELKKPSF